MYNPVLTSSTHTQRQNTCGSLCITWNTDNRPRDDLLQVWGGVSGAVRGLLAIRTTGTLLEGARGSSIGTHIQKTSTISCSVWGSGAICKVFKTGSIKLSFTKVLGNLILHRICSRDQNLICKQYLLGNKTYLNLTDLCCVQCLMHVVAHTSKMNNFFSFLLKQLSLNEIYEGWNFNSGNYLFTTDTK